MIVAFVVTACVATGITSAQDRGCPAGEIPDCNGNCAPESWIGDGICDDGVFTHHGQPIHFDCLFEREKYPEDVTEADIELNAAPATRLHMLDFLAAIDQRSRPVADIEDGHISTASCILANIGMELGRGVSYDPKRREVTGDAEATRLLTRAYRKPWVHPKP